MNLITIYLLLLMTSRFANDIILIQVLQKNSKYKRFCVFFTNTSLFVLRFVILYLCISSLLLFVRQYRCNRLSVKTRF